MPRRSGVSSLLAQLRRGPGSPPLHDQLHRALVTAVEDGRLRPGDRLPSSRDLAADLHVSRGAVVSTYARLADEGHVRTSHGAGTWVTGPVTGPGSRPAPAAGLPGPPVHDLRPGAPDLSTFPRTAWLGATRTALREMSDSDLGYVPPWGDPVLREALAAHIARSRSMPAAPENVIITSGTTQALTLTCRVLVASGHSVLAVEDPSNAIQRQVLSRYGLRMVDVPVDDEGIDVDALRRCGARAVLVTPAHQYPCGVALSARRRVDLLAWARDVDGVILEDDYDAEFSFARTPTPSLRSDAPELVVHTASVSKTLAPGLRLGWVVPPRHMLTDLIGAKRDDDFGSGVVTQRAMASMLVDGTYYRHVRQRREQYRKQRAALVAALADQLPDWSVRGAEAGMHLSVLVPPGIDEAAVVDAAAARAVLVLGMGSMRRLPGPPALVLGFGRLHVRVAPDAVARLRAAVLDASAGSSRRVRASPSLPKVALAARLGTTAVDYFPRGLTPGVEPPIVPTVPTGSADTP